MYNNGNQEALCAARYYQGVTDLAKREFSKTPANPGYWDLRDKFLKADHADGHDPALLSEMLSAVTLDHPDLDEVREKPWPDSPDLPSLTYKMTFIFTWSFIVSFLAFLSYIFFITASG